jgi:Ca2+-binding RTX toxin-like protein
VSLAVRSLPVRVLGFLVGTVVASGIGLALTPTSAEADPVFAEDCRAQMTGVVGRRWATLTISCAEQQINGTYFFTNRPSVVTGFTGEKPGHGLVCHRHLPGVLNDHFCFGHLDPGEVGTARLDPGLGARDACVRGRPGGYRVGGTRESFFLSTGPRGPIDPLESDVRFGPVRIQCAPEPNPCTIRGTAGNDVIRGTPDNDVICGGDGNDIVYGLGGNDVVRGGRGDDVLRGGPGNDRLEGGEGDDQLIGGAGDDRLNGGPGSDSHSRQDGSDTLNARDGVGGNDVATGGPGADSCATDPRDPRTSC